MALQSSGAISLDDIHDEAGGTSGSTATINDADIRALINKSSGASMAFNEWYGASNNPGYGLIIMGLTSGYSNINTMDYISIASTGNSADWGDAGPNGIREDGGGLMGSVTRGVFPNNFNPQNYTASNVINLVSLASTGDASDFGDLTNHRHSCAFCSSATQGLIFSGIGSNSADGTSGNQYHIDKITIASAGNASNFGNAASVHSSTGVASPTRAIHAGGRANAQIEYVTFGSDGNASSFGSLTVGRGYLSSAGSTTRGLILGGYLETGAKKNTIDYITIANTGNASDFGDLSTGVYNVANMSNSTRVATAGGNSTTNVIEYVTVASTGNASDFGDLQTATNSPTSASSAHGGIAA